MTQALTTKALAVKAVYRSINKIDVHDIRQMYGIYCQYYENTAWDIFLRDLSNKTGAMILICPKEQRIVGFSTVMTRDMTVQGKVSRGVFSGDTIIEKAYWGSRALQLAFYKFLLTEKARHPRKTIYWLLISKGFKTYLLLANNFVTYYPHPENKHSYLADVVDDYCQQMFADYYDAQNGILDFGQDYQCLKGDVANITESMRRTNTKIAYFEQCNPEWRRGTELPCVGVFDFKNLSQYVLRYLSKATSNGRKDALQVATPKVHELHPQVTNVAQLKRSA